MLDPDKAWTRQTLMAEAVRLLEEAGVEEARRNAEWLLCDLLGCSRALLRAYPEQQVPPEAVRRCAAALARRRAREPLQYILGYTEFYGLRLQVTPAVLIPRPETEQVVEEALALLRPVPAPRVLDVGTGSGCIALAIQQERPDGTVYACDLSPAALAVAAANAVRHELAVHLLQADALAPDFPAQVPDALDLLIANPPYIPCREAVSLAPEVRDHEPPLALFTEEPLLFYRRLTAHARTLLSPGGFLVFETHADYGEAVRDLLEAAGFMKVQLKQDLAGRPRIVTAGRAV